LGGKPPPALEIKFYNVEFNRACSESTIFDLIFRLDLPEIHCVPKK